MCWELDEKKKGQNIKTKMLCICASSQRKQQSKMLWSCMSTESLRISFLSVIWEVMDGYRSEAFMVWTRSQLMCDIKQLRTRMRWNTCYATLAYLVSIPVSSHFRHGENLVDRFFSCIKLILKSAAKSVCEPNVCCGNFLFHIFSNLQDHI